MSFTGTPRLRLSDAVQIEYCCHPADKAVRHRSVCLTDESGLRAIYLARSDLKPARNSSVKILGSSQAAKWPPFLTSLK